MKWFDIKDGATRYIKRFAFLPIRINTEHRWLETCYILQRYHVHVFIDNEWSNVMFVDREEYLNWRKEQMNNGRSKKL